MIDKKSLENLLMDNNKIHELNKLTQFELSEMFSKEFSIEKGYNQNNPHHCYDLLEHSLNTVCGINRCDLSLRDFLELRVAALFHDVGKPFVAFEKNGRTVFYNHAGQSARIALHLLPFMGYSDEEIKHIIFYIAHHDDFISLKCEYEIPPNNNNPYIKAITMDNVLKIIKKTNDTENDTYPCINDFLLLLHLCRADARAQSEKVIMNGYEVDSKERKLKRYEEIETVIKQLNNHN